MVRQANIPDALAQAAQAAGLSPAIRAGDTLYLTGATGGRSDGTMPDTPAEQAQVALDKVQHILAHAGATQADVVEITSYHIDIRAHFTDVERVLHRVFAPPLPAWTAVGVAELRRPGALVEFRIVAHHPKQEA